MSNPSILSSQCEEHPLRSSLWYAGGPCKECSVIPVSPRQRIDEEGVQLMVSFFFYDKEERRNGLGLLIWTPTDCYADRDAFQTKLMAKGVEVAWRTNPRYRKKDTPLVLDTQSEPEVTRYEGHGIVIE